MLASDFDAARFAADWIEAWNRHDIEAILAHFDEKAVFTSPLARALGHGQEGVVEDKPALRRYWRDGLKRNAKLAFQLLAAYRGVDTVVIVFRNEAGQARTEILHFRDGLVVEGHGTDKVADGPSPKG